MQSKKYWNLKIQKKNDAIMEAIKGRIGELSLNMYGCRVMQQLITVIDKKYLPQITEELEGIFEKCIDRKSVV